MLTIKDFSFPIDISGAKCLLTVFATFTAANDALYAKSSFANDLACESVRPVNCFASRNSLCKASHKFFYDKYIVMQSKVRRISDSQQLVRLLLTSTSHNNSQCPRSLSQSRRSLLFTQALSESRLGTRSAYAFSNASRLAFESALADIAELQHVVKHLDAPDLLTFLWAYCAMKVAG